MACTKKWGSTSRRLITVAVLALTTLLGGGLLSSVIAADSVIYSEGLASGWQNWSWSSSVNLWQSGGSWGAFSMGWQMSGGWAGLFLHSDSGVQTGSGTSLQ